jgi:hypothetical protein
MKKNGSASMVKGIGIGMALGGITGAVGSTFMSKSTMKSGKKSAAKALRSFSDMLDNIQYMMK